MERQEAQKTYYAKAVVAVHGFVLRRRAGKSQRFVTWSRDKTKNVALLATIMHQILWDNEDLLHGIKYLHLWVSVTNMRAVSERAPFLAQ